MRFSSILLLSLLLAGTLQATTVQRLDLDGLVSIVHEIVVGKVSDSETYWSSDGRLILTRHTIEVAETLKGPAGRTLVITTIGGTIGDETLYVAGMPVFRPGEDTVVFLEASGPYRTVVGLGQGKFSVADGFVSNNVSSLEFTDRGLPRQTRMPFDVFKEVIRQNLLSGNVR